jgi:hypothetical protein
LTKQFQFTQSDIDACKAYALSLYGRQKDYEEPEELTELLDKNFGDNSDSVFGFFIWYFGREDMKQKCQEVMAMNIEHINSVHPFDQMRAL